MPQTKKAKRKKAKIRRSKQAKIVSDRPLAEVTPDARVWLRELAERDERSQKDYLSRLIRSAAIEAGIVSDGRAEK